MKVNNPLSTLSETAQIRSSGEGGIYSNSNKPTGVFAKLRMAFSAMFRSKETQDSFRKGYQATRQLVQQELGDKGVQNFDAKFGNRLQKGSPLTAGKVREFITNETNEKNFQYRVSQINEKITALQGDESRFGDLLTSIFEELHKGKESGSALSEEGLTGLKTAFKRLLQNFGFPEPKEAALQRIFTFIDYKKIDEFNEEFLDLGMMPLPPLLIPVKETPIVQAICDWGLAQGELSHAEKKNEPLSDERINELKKQQKKSYSTFKREIKAASAPRERIELDEQIMPNENMDHSFHLSHKSLEIIKDLYAKRPQGDKLFEFS